MIPGLARRSSFSVTWPCQAKVRGRLELFADQLEVGIVHRPWPTVTAPLGPLAAPCDGIAKGFEERACRLPSEELLRLVSAHGLPVRRLVAGRASCPHDAAVPELTDRGGDEAVRDSDPFVGTEIKSLAVDPVTRESAHQEHASGQRVEAVRVGASELRVEHLRRPAAHERIALVRDDPPCPAGPGAHAEVAADHYVPRTSDRMTGGSRTSP